VPEITIEQPDPTLDFPLAWAIANAGVNHTDPACSYVQTTGALLCDCGAVEKAYSERLEEYRAVAKTAPAIRKRANERAAGQMAELTEDERKALPAIHHRPHWDGLGKPHSWICTACWGDGWQTSWPCEVATAGGRELAQHLGLEFAW
jgi:hypothetical protein